MPRWTRRTLLSSLVAGTAATALGGCARGTANPTPSTLRLGHAYGVGFMKVEPEEWARAHEKLAESHEALKEAARR